MPKSAPIEPDAVRAIAAAGCAHEIAASKDVLKYAGVHQRVVSEIEFDANCWRRVVFRFEQDGLVRFEHDGLVRLNYFKQK